MITTMHQLTLSGRPVSLVAPAGIRFPTDDAAMFPHCCGAGDGIGDLIVPESILGVPVSAACFIHDWMWDHAEPTWEYFHSANSVFLTNLITLIEQRPGILKPLRFYRAVTYFNAVDTVGRHIFWHKFKAKRKR